MLWQAIRASASLSLNAASVADDEIARESALNELNMVFSSRVNLEHLCSELMDMLFPTQRCPPETSAKIFPDFFGFAGNCFKPAEFREPQRPFHGRLLQEDQLDACITGVSLRRFEMNPPIGLLFCLTGSHR